MSRVAAILLVAGVTALAAAPGCDRDQPQTRQSEEGVETEARERTPSPHSVIRLGWAQAPAVAPDSGRRAEVEEMATRFGRGLVGWLYGNRNLVSVPKTTTALRRELAESPPFIPHDQLGTGEGRPVSIEIALQTNRSGVVTVVVADGRTSYRLPASFERRRGRWSVTHLNDH